MKPTSVVLVFDTLSGWSSLPHEGHNMLHINITSLKKCVLSPNILCSSGMCDTHMCLIQLRVDLVQLHKSLDSILCNKSQRDDFFLFLLAFFKKDSIFRVFPFDVKYPDCFRVRYCNCDRPTASYFQYHRPQITFSKLLLVVVNDGGL